MEIEQLQINQIADLSIQEQDFVGDMKEIESVGSSSYESWPANEGNCAICLDEISLQETALVKGCEHAYCVTCILRWATYQQKPSCPQCKHPFSFLNIHRSLDGRIHDYMFEESVCLLLRASWFVPLSYAPHEEPYDDFEEHYRYQYGDDDEDEDLDDVYYNRSSSVRIGNRRWGDNGYVRGGRIEARPVAHEQLQDPGVGSSRGPKKKEAAKDLTGRRAKRALKREAADKAAAAKHQSHLERLGRSKVSKVVTEASEREMGGFAHPTPDIAQ
ncbi:hypothetical protein ACHQM5_012771 [Ranunculus cassubicifolius]